jgi:hypothetical protein
MRDIPGATVDPVTGETRMPLSASQQFARDRAQLDREFRQMYAQRAATDSSIPAQAPAGAAQAFREAAMSDPAFSAQLRLRELEQQRFEPTKADTSLRAQYGAAPYQAALSNMFLPFITRNLPTLQSLVKTKVPLYSEKYPDIAAEYAKLSAEDKEKFPTIADYEQYHYQTYGQKEGRESPTLGRGDLTSPYTTRFLKDGGAVSTEDFIAKKSDGGDVSRGDVSRETLPPNPAEVPSVIDEREEIRSESQRMLNRLASQSKLPPGLQRTIQGARARQGESMIPAAVPARDVMAGMFGAQAMNPGSEAYRTGQALANSPPVEVLKAPAKIASAAGDAATALSALGGAGVIKPKGGNWLAGTFSAEQALKPLKRTAGARNLPADQVLAEMNATYTPEAMAKLSPESLAQVERAYAELKPAAALNKWIDTKLTKYVKNEMATPEDPVRALAERGTLHFEPQNVPNPIGWNNESRMLFSNREAANYPTEGLGKSNLARDWETLADLSVQPDKAEVFLPIKSELERNPWLEKVSPDTPVYGMNLSADMSKLGFNHIIDELANAMSPQSGLPDSLRIQPKDLEKITVPQAVEKVAKINEWRIENAKTMALQETLKADLYKAYPEQDFRWVQLNRPGQFAAESDAMGHSVRGYEPPEKGGSRSYGLGGWDAIEEGRAKVYSLRDKKGQPHVTIEVASDLTLPRHDDVIAEMERFKPGSSNLEGEGHEAERLWDKAYYEASTRVMESRPAAITQIKGKGNSAPDDKYLPFVQDFVRSGSWSDVNDLQNTGLYSADEVVDFMPKSFEMSRNARTLAIGRARAAGELPPYMTRSEYEDILKKYAPEDKWLNRGYKRGGPVDKTTAFIKAHA